MQNKLNLKEKELEKIFGNWYIQLSKPTIKIFGLEAALMLCNLYSEFRYWKGKNKLSSEYGSFFSTVENVQHNTGLSKSQQLKAIKVLEEYGIIKKYLHGNPPKRYFQFLNKGISKLIVDVRNEIKKDKERKREKVAMFGSDDIICFDEITGEVLTNNLLKEQTNNQSGVGVFF